MPSTKRIPPPLPSPSVYDDDEGYDGQQPGSTTTVVGAGRAKVVDVERGGGGAAGEAMKRKTLFQRAIEGWWDLGLLSRGDTVRAKTSRPFPSSRKERGVAEGGFL